MGGKLSVVLVGSILSLLRVYNYSYCTVVTNELANGGKGKDVDERI